MVSSKEGQAYTCRGKLYKNKMKNNKNNKFEPILHTGRMEGSFGYAQEAL